MRIGQCLSLGVLLSASLAFGQGGIGPITTQVPKANQRVGTPNTTDCARFQNENPGPRHRSYRKPFRRHH